MALDMMLMAMMAGSNASSSTAWINGGEHMYFIEVVHVDYDKTKDLVRTSHVTSDGRVTFYDEADPWIKELRNVSIPFIRSFGPKTLSVVINSSRNHMISPEERKSLTRSIDVVEIKMPMETVYANISYDKFCEVLNRTVNGDPGANYSAT